MNHYELLGVSQGATQSQIESAWRIKTRLFHPDKLREKDTEQDREMLHKLNEAKRILTDDFERRRYDRELQEQANLGAAEAMRRQRDRDIVQELFRRMAAESARQKAQEERVSQGLHIGCKWVVGIFFVLFFFLGGLINYNQPSRVYSYDRYSQSSSRNTNYKEPAREYIKRRPKPTSYYESIEGRVIAIDFGTSYSRVGVFVNGSVHIIPNEYGNMHTPSCVSFNAHCDIFVGDIAQKKLIKNSESTVIHLKRLLGRKSSDSFVKQYDLNSIIISQTLPQVQIACSTTSKTYTIEEITALLFMKLKSDAEAFFGETVQNVLITVPSHFNNLQRQMTKDAGAIAGLRVIKLLNEPTASMVTYGLSHNIPNEHYFMVFGMGGGNLDVTLFASYEDAFDVLASSGNSKLGGEDFNKPISNYFLFAHGNKTRSNVYKSLKAKLKMNREVERVKRKMCSSDATVFTLKVESLHQDVDFNGALSVTKFNELNQANLDAILKPVKQVLMDADVHKKEISKVILAGGATCLPSIQQKLKGFFINKDIVHVDKTGLSVIKGATLMSAAMTKQEGVPNINVLDVTYYSLGIPTTDGTITKLIKRNSYTPVSAQDSFIKDKEKTKTNVNVYEGESKFTTHNNYLGMFELSGLASGSKNLQIVFEVDSNGILKVYGYNVGQYKDQYVTVTEYDLKNTMQDIDRMKTNIENLWGVQERMQNRHGVCEELEKYIYIILDEIKRDENIEYEDTQKLKAILSEEVIWINEHQDVNKAFYVKRRKDLQLKVQKIRKKYVEAGDHTAKSDENREQSEKEEL